MTGISQSSYPFFIMLKDTQVKNLKPQDKPYRKLDADRLYIEVRPSGKKFDSQILLK